MLKAFPGRPSKQNSVVGDWGELSLKEKPFEVSQL